MFQQIFKCQLRLPMVHNKNYTTCIQPASETRMTFKYIPNPKSNNLQWMCAWVTLWLIGVRTVGLFAEKMQCLILSWAIWVSCDKYNIDVDYCPVDSGCKCALLCLSSSWQSKIVSKRFIEQK